MSTQLPPPSLRDPWEYISGLSFPVSPGEVPSLAGGEIMLSGVISQYEYLELAGRKQPQTSPTWIHSVKFSLKTERTTGFCAVFLMDDLTSF